MPNPDPFRNLRRLERPRPPRSLPPALRPIWRTLAPQVCAFSPVTKLDLAALEMLCMEAYGVERCDADIAKAGTARERQLLLRLQRRYRESLWEMCRAFLIESPEVRAEIVMPSGRSLADLVGDG